MTTKQVLRSPRFAASGLRSLRSVALGLVVGAAGAWALPASSATAASMFACSDPSNLCASGGAWQANAKATPAEAAQRNRKTPAKITLNIEGGRGSLFINGRYSGSSPLSGAQAPSGKNDIQVRDGTQVLAMGTLDVPPRGSVALVVNHR